MTKVILNLMMPQDYYFFLNKPTRSSEYKKAIERLIDNKIYCNVNTLFALVKCYSLSYTLYF